MKLIYNPKHGADITKFVLNRKRYVLRANELKKFDDFVANELLSRYEFLIEVMPEDVVSIQEQMESTPYKCEFCEESFADEKQLNGHILGKHKLSKEAKAILELVPEADSTDLGGGVDKKDNLSPENQEGIPTGDATDRDGVEWYGEGWTTDAGFQAKKKPHGSFGGK